MGVIWGCARSGAGGDNLAHEGDRILQQFHVGWRHAIGIEVHDIVSDAADLPEPTDHERAVKSQLDALPSGGGHIETAGADHPSTGSGGAGNLHRVRRSTFARNGFTSRIGPPLCPRFTVGGAPAASALASHLRPVFLALARCIDPAW